MGNWRRAHVTGSCGEEDVPALREAIEPGPSWERFGPLSNAAGLCGLNDWGGTTIDRVGNLAERDYGPEQVADHLRQLVAAAPSLKVKIDLGGDWEVADCVATVVVGEDGSVGVLPPSVETIPDIPEGQMAANLNDVLMGKTRW